MFSSRIEDVSFAVKKAVSKVDENAKIILFGSRARGVFNEDSDWDFLILTDKEITSDLQDEIRAYIYDLELDIGQVITSIIENRGVWEEYQVSEFYKNVEKDGIEILLPTAA